MPKNPEGVVPSEASVSLFNKIIGKTYQDVYDTLEKANPTDKFRRQQILNQIQDILNQADADTQAWVKLNIPGFYEKGMFETVKGINERGGAVNINNDFAHFHREAIEALSQETYSTIAAGMVGIKNNAVRIINNATREGIFNKIASGQITGETGKEIQKRIADELRRSGISALVDRGGKTWDLRRYGEMLARTSLTRAHNSGLSNRMAGGGYDLVMVSSHYTSCDLCAPWQGEILSLGGKSPAFKSLSQAEAEGLFHPNCRHTYSPYHAEFFDKAQIWDTDQQKYVSADEYKAENIHRAQFVSVSKKQSELMDYNRDSFIKREFTSSTVGMKKQYSDLDIKFDGSQVLPKKMTTHIIDDAGRKVDANYPELGAGFVDKFHKALDANDYKTLEDLRDDLYRIGKSLKIPADPFKYRLAEIEKSYFSTKGLTPKVEKVFVMNPKTGGIAFANVGTNSKVGIPRDYWNKLKNSVLIHNHPDSTAFSMEDLVLASKMNVERIKVVSDKYTYEMIRPAAGWGAKPKEVQRMYQTAVDTVKKDLAGLSGTMAEMTQEASHMIIENMAGALGWEYKRY